MNQLVIFITSTILFIISAKADIQGQKEDQYTYNYNNTGCTQIYDPYEKINRKIFAFNSLLDYFLLRPITLCYKNITNDYTKSRVSSFIDNINTPLTVVNYGLQMNYDQTMKSLWQFIINTTLGIGGLFDVSSKIGLTTVKQTFGSTLAHYGVAPGPYLVIPILGGTSTRDVSDSLFTNDFLNPIMHVTHRNFKLTVTGVQMIDTRLALLPFTDFVAQNSIDPYVDVRSATHQNRESVLMYPAGFKCPQP